MRISDWSSDVCSSDLILKSSLSRSRGEDLDGSSPPQNRRLADNPFSPTACLTQRNIWGAAPLVGQEARPSASGKTRRSEERRVGNERVLRVDLGGSRIINKKRNTDQLHQTTKK